MYCDYNIKIASWPENLPLELYTHIFSFLDYPSLLKAEGVSRAFQQAVGSLLPLFKTGLLSEFLIKKAKHICEEHPKLRSKAKLVAELARKDLNQAVQLANTIVESEDKIKALLSIAKRQMETNLDVASKTICEAEVLFDVNKHVTSLGSQVFKTKWIIQAHFDLDVALKMVNSKINAKLQVAQEQAKIKIAIMQASENPAKAIEIAQSTKMWLSKIKALCHIADEQRLSDEKGALVTLEQATLLVESVQPLAQPRKLRQIARVQKKINENKSTETLKKALSIINSLFDGSFNYSDKYPCKPESGLFFNKQEKLLIRAELNKPVKKTLRNLLKKQVETICLDQNNYSYKLLKELLLLQHNIDPDSSIETYALMQEKATKAIDLLNIAKTQTQLSAARTMDCLNNARDKVKSKNASIILRKIVKVQSHFNINEALKTAFLITKPHVQLNALMTIHRRLVFKK